MRKLWKIIITTSSIWWCLSPHLTTCISNVIILFLIRLIIISFDSLILILMIYTFWIFICSIDHRWCLILTLSKETFYLLIFLVVTKYFSHYFTLLLIWNNWMLIRLLLLVNWSFTLYSILLYLILVWLLMFNLWRYWLSWFIISCLIQSVKCFSLIPFSFGFDILSAWG
jgi:hypothetical protein